LKKVGRWLNLALALVGLILYWVYVTKGASFYDKLPGGRKIIFGLLVLAFGGLLVGRLYLHFQPKIKTGLLTRLRAFILLPSAFILPIVVLAFVVRLWGVNFGLPYLEHVDEWNVAERALHIVQSGSFDPYDYRNPSLADDDRQAFTYPSLFTYLQTEVFTARFLQGVAAGHYDGTSNLSDPLVKADFYEWGRELTALLGAGTVLLVFLIGRRYYGRRAGLVGALFLSFFYLHALNSHWITTDVPSGFFALLPFFWIYRIGEGDDRKRIYLLGGLFCGLAMGSKYNNLLILLPLVLSHLLSRSPRRWLNWNLPLAFAAIFAGFFISSPFIFWHLPAFFKDLAAIINHYQNEGHPGFDGSDNWRYYISAMWADNAVVVALALAGVALAFARHKRQDIIFLSFPLLSYIQLSGYKVNFTRNLMPIIPFLTILAGWALVVIIGFIWEKGLAKIKVSSANLKSWQNPTLGVVAILAIISPALAIVNYDRYNAYPTNRARATEYIEKELPQGSKLWIEPFSVDMLPRSAYRVEGGKSALEHPPEWYAANGYNYLVLSEAYYKEAYETAKPEIRETYRALIEGPRPAGLTLVQDFPKNTTDRPGGRILILSTGLPTVTTTPTGYKIPQPLEVNFGNKIKLLGTDLPAGLKPGTIAPLVFYWQTLAPVQQDYTTFIHLLDNSGKIVAQLDLAPLSGTRPTSLWKPDEIVRDEYPLTIPANLSPGEYKLVIGLYIPPNGGRLKPGNGTDEAEVARLKLG
jgi:4-amino-4-deoxy-L-arabinose transferase-like glycosyltransferase